jgi:hypothetical protein
LFANEIIRRHLVRFFTQHDLPAYDAETVSRNNQRMRLLLSGLSQLMTSFACCYDNELRHWCQVTPPDTTQLAAHTRRVHSLLTHFSAVSRLENANKFSVTFLLNVYFY